MEYANAPGPLTVSLSVALNEMRTEALIWDADGSHNHHVQEESRKGEDEVCSYLGKGAHKPEICEI